MTLKMDPGRDGCTVSPTLAHHQNEVCVLLACDFRFIPCVLLTCQDHTKFHRFQIGLRHMIAVSCECGVAVARGPQLGTRKDTVDHRLPLQNTNRSGQHRLKPSNLLRLHSGSVLMVATIDAMDQQSSPPFADWSLG
ncbi:unnamed protein product [Phytophthora fragariaefolia]|uniref:Unnamed protein product n=1 Tax=Phytophthora fragariaefolia TaxID=1490495 RepID=A0A9W7CWC9_9STRA|nr:unnamed protein product [Phytophthora fragariaefolia]